MKEKRKHSQPTPIAWRTYLDGCGLIAFIFVAFWGILIFGIILAVQYGITTFAGIVLVLAIMWELVRQERHNHHTTSR